MKKSCTIIISHFESENFLHTCIRQTRKMAHPEIEQHIIIAEQSGEEMASRLNHRYGRSKDITIVRMLPLYSGFGLDYIFRNIEIKTEYVCQLHVDAFGISDKYLMLPIKLIEENNLSFVGQLQFISKPTDTIYPPSIGFFAMAQCYSVARTETYKELSLKAGFTRFHNRPQSGLTFENDDWAAWASEDYNARGSDDDIVAFHYEDTYLQHDKIGLAISGFCEASWGRIIDGLVFHFCSAREAIGVMDKMPELYQYYTKRINENFSDELIEEMVNLAKENKPPSMEILSRNYWDGKLKQHFPTSEEINKRIEELKA